MVLVLAPPRDVEVLDEGAVDFWLAGLSQEAFTAEEVQVVRHQLDDGALGHLAPIVLQRCTHLQRLDLSGNALTDHGCSLLAECLASCHQLIGCNFRLQALLLTSNNIGPAGAEAVALSFFPPNGADDGRGRTVYTLALSENPLGDQGVASVAKAVRGQRNFVVLRLSGVACGQKGCSALTESLAWLSGLDISDNSGIPSSALTSLLADLGQPLQHLSLGHLTSGQRGGLAAQALSQALTRCRTLQTLGLAGNELQDSGLRLLADALMGGDSPALKELELAGNKLRDGNFLAKLLAGSPSLESLNLEANELNDMSIVALTAGWALSPTGRLRKLVLARNRFGNDGIVALSDMVRHPHTSIATTAPGRQQLVRWLTSLSDTQGGVEFWDSCDNRQGLRQLDLSFNIHVTDPGAEALAEAVIQEFTASCSHLRLLNLYDSCIGVSGRTALEKAVRASHARVEVFAGELLAALGGGGSAADSSSVDARWPPLPLRVQGLDGFDALDTEFAAKALSWNQACQRLCVTAALPPTLTASSEPAAAQVSAGYPAGVPVEAETVAMQPTRGTQDAAVATPEASPVTVEPAGGAQAGDAVQSVMERARRALQRRATTPASPHAGSTGSGGTAAATPPVAGSPPATAPRSGEELASQSRDSGLTREGTGDAAVLPELPAMAKASAPAVVATYHPLTDAFTYGPPIGAGPSSQDATGGQEANSSPSGQSTSIRVPAAAAAVDGAAAAASRAEAVLSRARQTLNRVATHDTPAAMGIAVTGASSAGHQEEISTAGEAPLASEVPATSAPPATSKVPVASETPAADDPLKATNKLEQMMQLQQVTSEWTLHRLPSETEPEAEAQTIVPERTVRLEREVAELREDVRRIENTVTSLNPEPECEAVIETITPAVSSTSSAFPVGGSSSASGDAAQAAGSPPLEGGIVLPVGAFQLPPVPGGKGRKGAGRAPHPPPPKRPGTSKGHGPPSAPPPKGGEHKSPFSTVGLRRNTTSMMEDTPFQRKLYWKQLDVAETQGTMFDEAQRDRSVNARPSLNTGALQSLFEGETTKHRENRSRSVAMLNRVQQKAVGLKILTDHRARNVAIVLRRIPVSTKELARILRQLEWEAAELSTEDLEQLLDIIPAQEEAEKLREHRSPEARANLRDVEQMVLPLALLSRGAARVRLLCIARSAKAQFGNHCRDFKSLRNACDAIHRSAMLREVMHLALDLGNYINHGDSSKGAKAISIGSLMTLREFKAGKINAMHYLCASLYFSNPDRDVAEVLAKELRDVINASKLQVQPLYAQVRCFERDLEVINSEEQNYIQEYASNSDPSPTSGDRQEAEEEDEPEEEITAGAVADMEAEADFPEEDSHIENAARWTEDVVKIRGSASRRLRCMRRIMDKLCKIQAERMKLTASQAIATLRFCGVMVNPMKKEIMNDLEPLLQQLAEFIKVFKTHWDEVRADLPRYEHLFKDSTAGNQQPGSSATDSSA